MSCMVTKERIMNTYTGFKYSYNNCYMIPDKLTIMDMSNRYEFQLRMYSLINK